VALLRKKTTEEPIPESRFDLWSAEDVFVALETSLSQATHQVDHWRACDAVQKRHVIDRLDVSLRTAVAAATSLRRRQTL
jgi:hypothetical protein